MSKSIFLKVDGGDFAAIEFENNFHVDEIYNQMIAEGLIKKTFYKGDEYYFNVEIYEFGEVDPNFESFVCDVLGDYDMQKSCNFYRVI